MSHNQNPVQEIVYPELCKELRRRRSAAIYGWDRPLLSFIYQRVLSTWLTCQCVLVRMPGVIHGKGATAESYGVGPGLMLLGIAPELTVVLKGNQKENHHFTPSFLKFPGKE